MNHPYYNNIHEKFGKKKILAHQQDAIQKHVAWLKEQAVIVGVYSNIFLIEERDSGYPRTHSLQYIDVLTKQIVIAELDN